MIQNDKYFFNWTDENFDWKFDGRPYTFKAGSVTPMTNAEFDHFANHLIDREMNKSGLRTNDQVKREEFLAKCQGIVPEIIERPVPLEAKVNTITVQPVEEQPVPEFEGLKDEESKAKRFCDFCDAKGPIKHKKDCNRKK